MISFNSSGDMGGVNERPRSTAQSSLLRDALVSGLDGKKRKVRTFGSDNIIIPEKLASRNGDKVPKKSGEMAGEAHVKQTNQQSHRFRVKASSSPSKTFYPTPLLGIFLTQSCGLTALVLYHETGPRVFGYRALHRRPWSVCRELITMD